MPTFKYSAKKGPGDTIEGSLTAQTREEAVDLVSQKGYFPIKVEEVTEEHLESPRGVFLGRVRSRDITRFTRQLSTLLRSGVPLLHGLGVISEQSESLKLGKMLTEVSDKVREGATLSSALAGYPKSFSPLYLALVRAGESSGILEDALARVADYRRKQEEISSRIRMALVYPGFMAAVGTATMAFMLAFVMPRLQGIFESVEQELPIPTKIVLALSAAVRQWGLLMLVALGLLFLVIRWGKTTKWWCSTVGRVKLRLPIVGSFLLKAELARFSRTLEVLVRSGISILEAIKTAGFVFGNEVVKQDLMRSYDDLEQGGTLGGSLRKSKFFPRFMSSLIAVGEESGRLDESLSEVAAAYETDVDEAVRTSTALLEPLMILIVGSVVGFMIIAMLLPIFQIDLMAGL